MSETSFVPYDSYREYENEVMAKRAAEFHELMDARRSCRSFADRPVDRAVIERCIMAASTAPSGAHMQPWSFVAVNDPAMKTKIRSAAEEEERAFYEGRAGEKWLNALSRLKTDFSKPFLETAPWLIVVFAQRHGISPTGEQIKHYYVNESVGIATGLLVAAAQNAGLASLTYTPSRMQFLSKVLGRPDNERAFLVLVVGYPSADVKVPTLRRKSLGEVAEFV